MFASYKNTYGNVNSENHGKTVQIHMLVTLFAVHSHTKLAPIKSVASK